MASASPPHPESLQLVSKAIGPLPLLNRFLERLKIERFFAELVPAGDRRQRLAPAVGLGVLLRNILIARQPLYGLAEWANRFEPALLGLTAEAPQYFNDDRVGRCLDALFRSDRATLMTEIVVHAVEEFGLELRELHNDSTTVTFTGQYAEADGKPERGHPTHRITHGINKDFRPDLKQLLFILTTTADGAVPIFSHVDHGNTSDDTTHIRTWESLRKLTGSSDFLYVADCKLCTNQNLAHIAAHGGRFVTVIPATWREHTQFHTWLRSHAAPWVEVLRRPDPRRKDGPPNIYRGYEHPLRTAQGFRVLWYFSSQKETLDRASREHRIAAADKALQILAARVGAPRSRLNSLEQVSAAAQKILADKQVERFLHAEVTLLEEQSFTQASRGRPGPRTAYIRHSHQRPVLHWHSDAQALLEEARTDGVFPLITNDETLTLKDVLQAYKHQPSLEKRHQQLKSVLGVRPVLLKSHLRIEAFLFLYFLALMTEALIERDFRDRMRKLDINKLPLYPEERPCAAPTTERLFELFADLRRHRLVDDTGRVHQRFYDKLNDPQLTVLRLFNISPQQYLSAAEESAAT
ncbi:MAG TPA: IS1634 family transposase [Terracidiphilus sp.]|jgi:transposase